MAESYSYPSSYTQLKDKASSRPRVGPATYSNPGLALVYNLPWSWASPWSSFSAGSYFPVSCLSHRCSTWQFLSSEVDILYNENITSKDWNCLNGEWILVLVTKVLKCIKHIQQNKREEKDSLQLLCWLFNVQVHGRIYTSQCGLDQLASILARQVSRVHLQSELVMGDWLSVTDIPKKRTIYRTLLSSMLI